MIGHNSPPCPRPGSRRRWTGLWTWCGVFLLAYGLLPGAAVSVVLGQPAQIILLRHGEKPEDPAATHLTERGQERARALPRLLGRQSTLTTNAPVAAIYATRISKKGHGVRTSETVAPLAQDLHLPIDSSFEAEDFASMARHILGQPSYRGRTVIICWTHHEIPGLARALGVSNAPSLWKDKAFDRLWVIDYSHGKPEFKDRPQRLLKGDTHH